MKWRFYKAVYPELIVLLVWNFLWPHFGPSWLHSQNIAGTGLFPSEQQLFKHARPFWVIFIFSTIFLNKLHLRASAVNLKNDLFLKIHNLLMSNCTTFIFIHMIDNNMLFKTVLVCNWFRLSDICNKVLKLVKYCFSSKFELLYLKK